MTRLCELRNANCLAGSRELGSLWPGSIGASEEQEQEQHVMKFHCQPTGSRRQMLAVCCAHGASCLTVLAHSLRLKTVDEHRVGCDRLGQGRRALEPGSRRGAWRVVLSFISSLECVPSALAYCCQRVEGWEVVTWWPWQLAICLPGRAWLQSRLNQ